ncbi:hypothetical protein GF319_09310 [Candidatus Bathyarchaeota archaeon]|nr:hypothetical protein [Candidatus Bathyarchaeota archaeon]
MASKTLFSTFFLGAIVGGVLGLMVAPPLEKQPNLNQIADLEEQIIELQTNIADLETRFDELDVNNSIVVYVGSRNSMIYHRQSCLYVRQIDPGNRITFFSGKDAVSAGYRPCKVCLP